MKKKWRGSRGKRSYARRQPTSFQRLYYVVSTLTRRRVPTRIVKYSETPFAEGE